ncbi:MAG: hypothetical protein MR016_04075 [Agathobacter sp.]|nr:hypothetical protein [Agathobacter sp.]
MKKLWKSLIAALLCATILTMTPVEFSGTAVQRAEVEAATKTTAKSATTIKVKKADKAAAEKVHKQLYQGKALTLQVKGTKKASEKLVKKLQAKVQKINKQGVLFQYKTGAAKDGYTTYTISTDNAKLYMYSVKFVGKLWKNTKKMVKAETVDAFYQDYLSNPNETERMLHTIYDSYTTFLVEHNSFSGSRSLNNQAIYETNNIWTVSSIKFSGISEKTTTGSAVLAERYSGWIIDNYIYQKIIKSVTLNGDTAYVSVMPYDEFIADKEIKRACLNEKYWKYYYLETYSSSAYKKGGIHLLLDNAEAVLYGTDNFCDLSDAMKIYAISSSKYFGCNSSHDDVAYGMLYDYTFTTYYPPSTDSLAMKQLYKNKATGVCQTFAMYEQLLFDQLGITNYFNSNDAINHAWSVVAVKNSKGKTLWIPFDYGIGPSEGLAVSEDIRAKYLATEEMRYQLYLDGVPGAPSKKNFTMEDFN